MLAVVLPKGSLEKQVLDLFSPDPDIGYVEVWKNRKLVLPRFQPSSGTMYPKEDGEPISYLKTGYYRNGAISTPGTIYFDNWKVGTSREAVAYSPQLK